MSGQAGGPTPGEGSEDNPDALLATAREHHRAGNLSEADRMYRQVLAAHPDDAEILHLLGVVSHQAGRHEDAVACIGQAIERDPGNPQFHLNLGSANLALSRLADAGACYRRALDLDPQSSDAYFNLGIVHTGQGELDQAVSCYQRSLDIDPGSADAHDNLGAVHLKMGNPDKAAACFRRSLDINPASEDGHVRLAVLSQHLGRADEAIAGYRQVIRLNPDHPLAHVNLGNLLQEQGRSDEAMACYRRAVEIDPGFADAHNNLGVMLFERGDLDEAAACFERCLEIDPAYEEGHYHLGTVYHQQDRPDDAIACYRRALEINPDNAQGRFVLGDAHKKQGNHEAAIAAYEQTLRLEPRNLKAKWCSLLTLPVIYSSPEEIEPARDRWAAGLARFHEELELGTEEDIRRAVGVITAYTNFYLHYQGRNDLDLQCRYGALVHEIARAAYPGFSHPIERRRISGGERIRVGFVSSNLHDRHTIYKLFGRWVAVLDRDKFEVQTFYTGDKSDEETANIRRDSESFHDGRCSNAELIRSISSKNLDVLVYTDIGMSPRVQLLAALRLAPVQCTTWGHPVTSGLPTIDFFLSSELMEPDDGDGHYRETLIRLPNLGISYPQPEVGDIDPQAPAISVKSPGPVYLCTQSLFKLLPEFDDIYPRIAARVGKCQFRFIENPAELVTNRFKLRLERAFGAHGMNARDHCVLYPQLSRTEFLRLNQSADVILDSMMWSGGNTTLEALSRDKPVVTLPGPMMRSRHSFAMLRMMKIDDTIAQDVDDYIEIAARLGNDSAWRDEIVQKITSGKSVIYDDPEPVRGLQDFIVAQCDYGVS